MWKYIRISKFPTKTKDCKSPFRVSIIFVANGTHGRVVAFATACSLDLFLIYPFSQTTYIKLLFFSSLQEVVDIATLTGACMVALGKDITGWDLHHFSGSDDTR